MPSLFIQSFQIRLVQSQSSCHEIPRNGGWVVSCEDGEQTKIQMNPKADVSSDLVVRLVIHHLNGGFHWDVLACGIHDGWCQCWKLFFLAMTAKSPRPQSLSQLLTRDLFERSEKAWWVWAPEFSCSTNSYPKAIDRCQTNAMIVPL